MPDRHRALAWFAVAATLYLLTSAPGPVWADSSKLVLYALHHYIPSLNPGDHPGWTAMAEVWLALVRWAEPSRALSLLSALSAAVAVGEIHVLVRRLTGMLEPADGAAAILLVCHPLWWAATIPETYAPAVALALGAALAATGGSSRAHDAATGLLAGAALSVHAFSAVLTIPFVLGPLHRRPATVAASGIVGTAPLWLAFIGYPTDPLTGYRAAGASSLAWHLGAFIDPTRAVVGIVFLAALLAFGLGPLGVFGLLRAHGPGRSYPYRRLHIVLLAALTMLLIVYSPYRVHLMVVFLVVGALLLRPPRLSRRQRLVHLVVQPLLYLAAVGTAQLSGHGDLGVRVLPDRSNAWYFLSPVRTFTHGPRRYAEALLDALPPDTLLLADFNPGAVLRLEQETRGLRRDVEVVPRSVNDALATADPAAALERDIRAGFASGRPVALADSYEPYYRIATLEQRYRLRFTPCGPGLLVAPPPAPPPANGSAPSRPSAAAPPRR